MAEDEAPLGLLLEAAVPPLVPPVLLEADPPLVLSDDEAAPPLELLVLPVAPGPGLGVVVDDEDDEPPGTMTVSFSLVTVAAGGGLAPGMTVVVDSFSQPASASAPATTNRQPLRFMFTLISSLKFMVKRTRASKRHADRGARTWVCTHGIRTGAGIPVAHAS